MNGIAALPGSDEFLLTGKGWRSLRHVKLVADRDRGQLRRMLAGPAVRLGGAARGSAASAA
jgi:hypothetical protein